MVFNSGQFLIFFPIVVAIYYLLPAKKNVKNIWLLIASYYFYMCWSAKYLILIFISTFITYLSGIALDKIHDSENIKNRNRYLKLTVAVSFILNLGILFVFKYFNFFSKLLVVSLGKVGIALNAPMFDLLLPVGISFYTFQALGYTADVYKREIRCEKNFINYALFVSFFPQLVAGPIERSGNLLTQLRANRKISLHDFQTGLLTMMWGFFLKIVLADRIAIYVDTVFNQYEMYNGVYLILAAILFAFQIYCDFYGYSTIAMGAAAILGIKLMENFEAPYLATSVAQFWRRWHISLTSWFKDYLYIPLGGSRKGKLRKYVNILIVFLTSGLWHGAALSFVAWGGINGLYQFIGDILKPIREKAATILAIKKGTWSNKVLSVLVTFALVDFAWIFFRARGIMEAFAIIRNMMTRNFWVLFDGSLFNCGLESKDFNVIIVALTVLFVSDYFKNRKISVINEIINQGFWFRCIWYVFALGVILLYGIWGPGYVASNFIYFQF